MAHPEMFCKLLSKRNISNQIKICLIINHNSADTHTHIHTHTHTHIHTHTHKCTKLYLTSLINKTYKNYFVGLMLWLIDEVRS